MRIAENIAARRAELNLTQEELAEKVGVTQAFISLVEKGFKTPSVEVSKRLAEALDTTIDELVS